MTAFTRKRNPQLGIRPAALEVPLAVDAHVRTATEAKSSVKNPLDDAL